MPNTDKIERKKRVADDYISKIINKANFFEKKRLDNLKTEILEAKKNLSISQEAKNKTQQKIDKIHNKTKQRLKDFLVEEGLMDKLVDDTFGEGVLLKGIVGVSEQGIQELKTAKEKINNAHNEQEARESLNLTTNNNPNTNSEENTPGSTNTPQKKENISNLIDDNIDIEVKGFDKKMVKTIILALQEQGIKNLHIIKAILSTIAKESKFNPKIAEISYKNTSNDRIRAIFGDRVKGLTDEELNKLKNNDIAFWDRVYGPDDPTGVSQKYGNTKKGDGFKYRGRGFNGLTFKSNYKKYGDMIGEDLVGHPELLSDPKIASKVNAAYFKHQLNKKIAKQKYNYQNFNDIKDFDTALDLVININAGIGKDINTKNLQENRERALMASQNFEFKNVA